MKINITHVAAALAVVALAYAIGKKRATASTKTEADTNIQSAAAWWTYAGQWNAS